jgi:hypothetical protein
LSDGRRVTASSSPRTTHDCGCGRCSVSHGSLGDAAAVVDFEVEVLTDRFETLIAEERTLP